MGGTRSNHEPQASPAERRGWSVLLQRTEVKEVIAGGTDIDVDQTCRRKAGDAPGRASFTPPGGIQAGVADPQEMTSKEKAQQWFSTRGNRPPARMFGDEWRHFWSPQPGSCCWQRLGGAQGCP